MTEPQLTDEFADRFLANVYRLWLIPEVQRRLSGGLLDGDTKIWAGQIIFGMTGVLAVQLNDEVNGIFHVRPEAALPEGVLLSAENALDIAANVVHFELDDHDQPDAAHVTVLLGERGFYITFDMRYNSALVAGLVVRAREFLTIARYAETTGSVHALIANLHIAVEALAKARLVLHPDNEILVSRNHGFLRARFNRHSKGDDAEQRFARLLNRLDELRNPARYSLSQLSLSSDEARSLIDDADAMLARVLAVSPGRTRRRVAPGV